MIAFHVVFYYLGYVVEVKCILWPMLDVLFVVVFAIVWVELVVFL